MSAFVLVFSLVKASSQPTPIDKLLAHSGREGGMCYYQSILLKPLCKWHHSKCQAQYSHSTNKNRFSLPLPHSWYCSSVPTQNVTEIVPLEDAGLKTFLHTAQHNLEKYNPAVWPCSQQLCILKVEPSWCLAFSIQEQPRRVLFQTGTRGSSHSS